MTIFGSLLVEINALQTVTVVVLLVVSVSIQDTLISCKRLADPDLDIGLLIKFVESYQHGVPHSTAKRDFQLLKTI